MSISEQQPELPQRRVAATIATLHSDIPDEMTLAEYRRALSDRGSRRRRRRRFGRPR